MFSNNVESIGDKVHVADNMIHHPSPTEVHRKYRFSTVADERRAVYMDVSLPIRGGYCVCHVPRAIVCRALIRQAALHYAGKYWVNIG